MSPGTLFTLVMASAIGLAWLSAVLSGSPEWGIGVFVLTAIVVFVSKRTRPGKEGARGSPPP
jgi:hypothetical protein